MFFGKCFDQLRPWGPVCRFKTDPEYAHYVFQSFASEYFGNSRASAQLFAAYKDCMCSIYRVPGVDAGTTSTQSKSIMPTFNSNTVRIFQCRYDKRCRLSFLNCFSYFNDYSMPILQISDFTNYQNASGRIFLEQWAFLSSLRNMNRDRDGSALTAFKERQVFVTIVLLLRQSNFRSLPHWCLILLTAMYGWGTRETLAHVTSFIGRTVSRIYRDRFFTSLTSSVVETDTTVIKINLWIDGPG